jgi:3-dehydroquinate synthase II
VRRLKRSVWVKADWAETWEKRKRFITAALEAGADAIVVPPRDVQKARELGTITVVASEPKLGVDVVMLSARSLAEVNSAVARARKIKEQRKHVAICVEISSKELERAAVRAGKVVDFLVAVAKDWKVIPLENLIAELHQADVKILAGVKDANEAKTAVETLEIGADGVFLDPREKGVEEIRKVCEAVERAASEKLELVPAKVLVVRPAGMGDRVCVDTSTIMSIGEGMLVGSHSDGMFLVHSESLQSKYVEPRPFRVNAGAVHAYVRLPHGRTKYLSELKAGDEVQIVNASGETRVGTVGRIKVERRPMLLVEVEHEGRIFKTLLQNAETINLVAKDGSPISVAKLRPGDEVLIHVERVGRHFGAKVAETILER